MTQENETHVIASKRSDRGNPFPCGALHRLAFAAEYTDCHVGPWPPRNDVDKDQFFSNMGLILLR